MVGVRQAVKDSFRKDDKVGRWEGSGDGGNQVHIQPGNLSEQES